jgi:hypothetical protein
LATPNVSGVTPAPDGGYPNGNIAEGENSLFSLDTSAGVGNTAVGFQALYSTITACCNTAIGDDALNYNTSGEKNTAVGVSTLFYNTSGSDNTADGGDALFNNTIGHDNTASGANSLGSNTTGNANTGIGSFALGSNTTGNNNIALGGNAGSNLTTGKNNIDIGNRGLAGESHTNRIGNQGAQTNVYVAGISGTTVPTGVPVIVDSSGHLGTTTSSGRFKEAIKAMDNASEAILALKPVTFRYKHDLDPDGVPQFGLVAEEVEKVNRDLVARDEQGKP